MDGNAASAGAVWVDAQGRPWQLELPEGHILLRSDSQVVDVPAASWRSDLYVAPHNGGFIVRIERFDSSLGFLVSGEQARPLLAHLGLGPTPAPPVEQTPAGVQEILWPRVSALAVWALACSSLAFVPVLGWLSGLAAVVLLVLHRLRVRRSEAYGHSRRMCAAAAVFLILGLVVSSVATWGILEHWRDLDRSSVAAHQVSERNIAAIVYGLFVVLLSLSVHEAAHAITAWWLGDEFARSLGRVTLNPLAHIDPFGTVLLPALLAWAGGPVFGYARPVPVRVENLARWRRAHVLISLAGPGSNLLLASASLLVLLAIGCAARFGVDGAYIANFANPDIHAPVTASGLPLGSLIAAFCLMLKISFYINVALAVFNLVPLPPLDGSWVLEHLFPGTFGRIYAVIRPFGMWIFIAAVYLDLFDFVAYPMFGVILPGLVLLSAATGM